MKLIAGVDEAGRGPLAGDVFAAAVILDPKQTIDGLNDSKKITPKRRELLFDEIIARAKAFAIEIATVAEIDSLNILNASMLAMQRAVNNLNIKPDLALIDGNKVPELDCDAKAIIGGDAVEACISAASILAKVARDRYMLDLAQQYPEYKFEQHKGYGTKLHMQMLREYGPTKVHRQSFAPVRNLLEANVEHE